MLRPNCLKFTFSLKKAPLTLFPMENWKKCRFNFQTYLHPNQDYSESVKDISSEKMRHLENSILHNRPVPKLAPLPQGGPQKNSGKNVQDFCLSLYMYAFQFQMAHSPRQQLKTTTIPSVSMGAYQMAQK